MNISKLIAKAFAAAALTIIVVACASSSTQPRAKLPKIDNPINSNIVWMDGSIHSNVAQSFVPLVDNGTIFTADQMGYIYRVDGTDGTIISKFDVNTKLSSGTAVSTDLIFVTTRKGALLAVSKATGVIEWRARLPTISIEAPQVGGDIVMVRTNDASLLGFNVHNGHLVWEYQRNSPPLTLRVYNSFLVVGKDVVILGQPGGRLVLLNVNTGVPIWENVVALPEGATDVDKLTDIAMNPALEGKQICVASFNGKLVCLDAISSNIMWAKPFSSASGILMDDTNVYTIDISGVVYGYNRLTGLLAWSNSDLQYRNLSSPAFLGTMIAIFDDEGNLFLLNPHNGKLAEIQKTRLIDGVSIVPLSSDSIVVQSGNGRIAKISN